MNITEENNKITINYYDNLEGASNIFSPIIITMFLISINNKNILKHEYTKKEIKLIKKIISDIFKKHIKWKYKFSNIPKMIFHDSPNQRIKMMQQINYIKYYENENIKIIEIPYIQEEYVMGIILPMQYLQEENMFYSIINVPHFTYTEINNFINNLEDKLVKIIIPKFIHHKKNDLQLIFNKLNLLIPKLYNETTVIINEKGYFISNHLNYDKTFIANHTFIYYIRYIPLNLFILYGDFQG